MKIKLTLLIALLAGSTFVNQLIGQTDILLYQAKSGIMEYKLLGKTIGTETVYFDHHGNYEARFRKAETKMLGMKTKENTLTIRLDSVIYAIDLDEKTGTRQVIAFDPSKMSEKEMKEWEAWGEEMRKDLGFEKIGEEKILGRMCDIWEGMGSKIWIWQNLTLKTEVNLMGQWIIEATKIDLNAKVSKDRFKVPGGIEIRDLGRTDVELTNEQMDSLNNIDLGDEFEKGIEDLKGILGIKKKKKK